MTYDEYLATQIEAAYSHDLELEPWDSATGFFCDTCDHPVDQCFCRAPIFIEGPDFIYSYDTKKLIEEIESYRECIQQLETRLCGNQHVGLDIAASAITHFYYLITLRLDQLAAMGYPLSLLTE